MLPASNEISGNFISNTGSYFILYDTFKFVTDYNGKVK